MNLNPPTPLWSPCLSFLFRPIERDSEFLPSPIASNSLSPSYYLHPAPLDCAPSLPQIRHDDYISMGIPGCNYPLDTLEGQASASTCMTMQAMIAETYLSGRETWEQNRALCIAVGGDLSENPDLYGPNEAQQNVEDWLVFIGMLPKPELDSHPAVTHIDDDTQASPAGSSTATLCTDTSSERDAFPAQNPYLTRLRRYISLGASRSRGSILPGKVWTSVQQRSLFLHVAKEYIGSRTSLLLRRVSRSRSSSRNSSRASSPVRRSSEMRTSSSLIEPSQPKELWRPPSCRAPVSQTSRCSQSPSSLLSSQRRNTPRCMTMDGHRKPATRTRRLEAAVTSPSAPASFSGLRRTSSLSKLQIDSSSFRSSSPALPFEEHPKAPWDTPLRTIPVPSYFYEQRPHITTPPPPTSSEEAEPIKPGDAKWYHFVLVMLLIYFLMASVIAFAMLCTIMRLGRRPATVIMMCAFIAMFVGQTFLGLVL